MFGAEFQSCQCAHKVVVGMQPFGVGSLSLEATVATVAVQFTFQIMRHKPYQVKYFLQSPPHGLCTQTRSRPEWHRRDPPSMAHQANHGREGAPSCGLPMPWPGFQFDV